MNKYEIVKRIEKFAPPELAESWDCSGWAVETNRKEVHKIMLCLTVTDNIIKQARQQNCDMIISHHPMFYIPFSISSPLAGEDVRRTDEGFIDIYTAHTNLDRAQGGTTNILISKLGFEVSETDDFLRFADVKVSIDELRNRLLKISPNLRYVNNHGIKALNKLAFCAGSGSDFLEEAFEKGADALITGDIKFHTALESPIVLFDMGHFESEILVLQVFEKLLPDVETIRADEKSPFIYD